ncbi:hypothetical protein PG991_007520 [Apiospora marii]|uniref:Uncharacterized protein n=1 Tax=Apiospora marii TaxID=335849 RepID=A0ABR1RTP2_9PEZI
MAHVGDWDGRQRTVDAPAGGGEPTVRSSPTESTPAATQAIPPKQYLYASDTNSAAQPPSHLHSNNNNNYSYAAPVSPASQWASGGDIGAQFAGYDNTVGGNGPQQHQHVSPELSSAGFSGGVMGSPPAAGDQQQRQQQASSAFNNYQESPNERPTSTARPKPSPLQFEDSNYANIYASPGLSTGSNFMPYATHAQRRAHHNPRVAQPQPTPPPYAAVLAPPKKWYQLRQAWVMYLFFAFGLLCAVGHHLFYKSLNGKPATDQLTMLRYGTVLAFAAKAGFVACIVTAFRQRIWATVRNKILSVAAIDSLFAATEDVVSLFNIEVYKKARIAMLLAVVAWLTPIVIILTSNTLVVELAQDVQNTNCSGIRTLNFSQEMTEDWRNATRINGLIGTSLTNWNTTKNPNIPDNAENWFDYYTSASKQFSQVATLSTFSHQVMTANNASWEICGNGWNCTYTVNFTAPGYKCTELTNGTGSKPKQLGENIAPFGMEVLLPEGDNSYYVHATQGDYSGMQYKNVSTGGMPIGVDGKLIPNKDLPPNLGTFRTEPILWIGYSVWKDQNTNPPNNRTEPGWNESFVPKIFACEHYVTDYVVDFKFDSKEQTATVKNRDFRHPIIDTVYKPGIDANDGTSDNITATPEKNYVYPKDLGPYRLVAAYHSLGSHLRKFINGTIGSMPVSNPIGNSDVIQTKLVDPTRQLFPYPNLPELVQEFYEDIILSLFSNQQFLAVVWAAKPDTKSGATTTGPKTGLGISPDKDKTKDEKDKARQVDPSILYPCTKSRYENRYKYIDRDLWIVYAVAMLCALAAMVLGTAAVLENEGVLRNTKFSSIVAATRGPALEKVRWHEDAQGIITPDVKKMRVGYGVVQQSPLSGGGVGAFGGEGQGLGVTSYNAAMDDLARYPRQSMVVGSPVLQQQQQRFSSYGGAGVGVGDEVRYGFGLEGDVRQSRRESSMFRGR